MIVAILLAAGRSRRMGTQKLLLPVDGVPLLRKVATAFPQHLVDRLLIVVRPDAHDLRATFQSPHLQWVENPMPESQMLDSIRYGLRAIPPETKTLLITPADMPALDAPLISSMLSAWKTCRHSLLVPVYQGRRGHPLILSALHVPEIMSQHDEVGLRGLLHAHSHDIYEWPSPSPAVLQDWDTSADLRH